MADTLQIHYQYSPLPDKLSTEDRSFSLRSADSIPEQFAFKDYRYQYFRRRELHIILRVLLPWYIAFNFALDSKTRSDSNADKL